MRVVYYTHTAFFEVALSAVRELSRGAEVHLLVETAPTAWRHAAFDVPERRLDAGLLPADEILRDRFPRAVRDYWTTAASFHLVAYRTRRGLHPASWRIGRRVLEFARSVHADVLHVDDVDVSPRMSLALPHARDLPVVISVHDPEPHSGERGWRKRVSRAVAFRRADAFVLHNASMVAPFCRRHRVDPAAVTVAPFAPLDLFRAWGRTPAPEPGAPTILFFGRISRYKGLDVLYRALPRLAERVPGVRLVVAGRRVAGYDPPPPPILAPPGRVEVHDGYIANPELARLLEEAAVVACPYHDATQSSVILTAYAFGRPVVATTVGGLPEYVDDGVTGLMVPPGDPAALAAALGRILLDPALRRRLSLGIETHARARLSWSRAADALLAAYARVAGGHEAGVT